MAPLSEERRTQIRTLFFVGGLTMREIARELRVNLRTVRRTLVLDGGAASEPPAGPYGKEHDS